MGKNTIWLVIALMAIVITGIVAVAMAKDPSTMGAVIFGFILLITTELIKIIREQKNTEELKSKTDEVKETLKETEEVKTQEMANLKAIVDQTHGLVNSSMRSQLLINVKATETLAAVTKNPTHIKEAKQAKELLTDHDKKQDKVDKQ